MGGGSRGGGACLLVERVTPRSQRKVPPLGRVVVWCVQVSLAQILSVLIVSQHTEDGLDGWVDKPIFKANQRHWQQR